MRTREKGYSDYGFKPGEEKELLKFCNQSNFSEDLLLLECAKASNEAIGSDLYFSLVRGLSFAQLDKCIVQQYDKGDFYAYRRKALGLFRAALIERGRYLIKAWEQLGDGRKDGYRMRLNGQKVTEIMEQKRLTAEMVCSRTGLLGKSFQGIIENGAVSLEAMERIADSIGVMVKEIILPDISGNVENGIEFIKGSDQATVYFSQGRYISRIKKLAAERPEECQIVAENADGSVCAHIPVSWVKISPPKQFTVEQRQQMAERLSRK